MRYNIAEFSSPILECNINILKDWRIIMKKTIDLLSKAVEMGFNREQALTDIDASLDAELEERKPLMEEEIPESLYDDILEGFRADKEMNA